MSRCGPSAGHDGDITDVAFNHDGTLLATTGTDAAARIWDPATGEELHTVRMPVTDTAWAASGPSFSRDGSLFAAAWAEHGVVKVVDLSSGQIVREISSVPGPKETSFDPTGARLAVTSSIVPTASVVDVASGNEVFSLDGHRIPIFDIAWSPDGESIATTSTDGAALIFDAGTGRQRFAVLGHRGPVYGLDWSPDSTRLVTAGSDGPARVWLLTGTGAREMMTLSAQDSRIGITGVAFSPDGTRVMTGDAGITAARVWDVGITGSAELANLPTVAFTTSAVDFTSDGRQLVATGDAGSVTVWDAQSFTPLRTLGAPSPSSSAPAAGYVPGYAPSGPDVFSLDVSPDGRLVAVARFDGSVRVWDMQTGRDAFTVDPGPTLAPYMNVAWSPDGDLLAIAANDGRSGRATIVDRSGRRGRRLAGGCRHRDQQTHVHPRQRAGRHEPRPHRATRPRRG